MNKKHQKSEWHTLPMIDEWIPIHRSKRGPGVIQLEHGSRGRSPQREGYLGEKTREQKRCKWNLSELLDNRWSVPSADKPLSR